MNYVRRSSCALIFALACMANAHANLENIVQAVTNIPDDCFTSVDPIENHKTYIQAHRNLKTALETVLGKVLLARATKELSNDAYDQVTIEKVKEAVTAKIDTIVNKVGYIQGDLEEVFKDFQETITFIEQLPVQDDEHGTVLAYLNAVIAHCCTTNNTLANWPKLLKAVIAHCCRTNNTLANWPKLLKVAQKVSSDEDKKVLQAQRDMLKLTLLKDIEPIIIKEAAQSAKTSPLYDALKAEELVPFAPEEEQKAVNNAAKKIAKVTMKNILPVACEIAQCIRKSDSDQSETLIAPFIEKFNDIAESSFESTMLDNVSSSSKIEAIRSSIKKAKKELLLAARIVLFAGEDKNTDLHTFEEQITNFESRLQGLYNESTDLEYSIRLSNHINSTSTLSKGWNMVKGIWNALPSFGITRHSNDEQVIDEEGDGDEEENEPVNYGVFEAIAQTLTDLDATQDDKITVLRSLRAQAKAIFKQVKVADYDAETQCNFLSNTVNLMISKFKDCFATVESANAFINENAPGQNRKAHVRAHTNFIKSKLTVENEKLIRDCINPESQAALDEFATLLTDIYNAANAAA